MSLLLLGISHHTAPVEVRERLALPEATLPATLALLGSQPWVREGMILSTCNRTEILVEGAEGTSAASLLHFMEQATRQSLPPHSSFYHYEGEPVVRHLFRVASSLDSQVVGEPQILGQLKQAFAAAQEAGVIGPVLEGLVPRAFHAAKRVRTETAVATQPVSVSQAAVELAQQIFGDLSVRTVLLLGAGAMGQDAARFLLQRGVTRLLVVNRTLARAQVLAAKYKGEAFRLEELPQRGELADIVITCTGSPVPLISRADAAHFLSRRRGRPMLFLDVAVPRDVDPDVHRLENAFVYNVDDLDQVVTSNLAERRQEARAGEKIIEAETAQYLQRLQTRDLAPVLRALHEHAENLRAAEWERLHKRLGPLSAEQEAAIEALTRSLMQKWLHHPLVELRAAASTAERAAMVEAAQKLFGLEAAPPVAAPVPSGGAAGAQPSDEAAAAAAAKKPASSETAGE